MGLYAQNCPDTSQDVPESSDVVTEMYSVSGAACTLSQFNSSVHRTKDGLDGFGRWAVCTNSVDIQA